MKDEPIYPIQAELVYRNHPDKDGFEERKLGYWGLTKREYFAAKILSGMMVTPDNIECRKISAAMSVKIADALIEALEKK